MSSQRAQDATERREREDAAVRLKVEYPDLISLRLQVREMKGHMTAAKFVRPIVVQSAPAHFELLCGDEVCKGGGHDVTWDILQALSRAKTQFEGSSECMGQLGSTTCGRVLHYVATAKFKTETPD